MVEDTCQECPHAQITVMEGATGSEACVDLPLEFSSFNPSELFSTSACCHCCVIHVFHPVLPLMQFRFFLTWLTLYVCITNQVQILALKSFN